MNRELAKKVADAVLYEGYMLYPYRRSAIKNRQRWSFGILYPPAYGEVRSGTERCSMHSECLMEAEGEAAIHVELRFLQLVTKRSAPLGDGEIEAWDEGVERSVEFQVSPKHSKQDFKFSFPASSGNESMRAGTDITSTQRELTGSLDVAAEKLRNDVTKLIIDVSNTTALPTEAGDRDSALLRSFLSAHTILTVEGGKFVSLLDPPEDVCDVVSDCKNVGNFPVLVGNAGERDMLLCSPIILYDYPQIAPESAGDFYDGTEMDEMLTLRVMTLTDQEKNEMRSADEHVRSLLQRTEQSAREQLMKTHGAIRSLRPVNGER